MPKRHTKPPKKIFTDFSLVQHEVTRRSRSEIDVLRKKYLSYKPEFMALAINEVCERYDGRERTQLLRHLREKTEVHHIVPLGLGGEPIDPSNLAVVSRRLHGTLHQIIDKQQGNIVFCPRYPSLVWLPNKSFDLPPQDLDRLHTVIQRKVYTLQQNKLEI